MKPYILSTEERVATGFTHKYVVPYTDLNTTAGTGLAVTLQAYTAGCRIKDAGWVLTTNFDGTSTTALTLKLGHDGATTDDDDSLIEAVELHNDGTEIKYGGGNGVAFATKVTGYVPLDAGNIKATFTSTSANLTDLSSGSVSIFLNFVDMTKY